MRQWTPNRAERFDRAMIRAGQEGAKMSVARVAKKAGVSEDFVWSLRVAAPDPRRRGRYQVREVTKVLAVLKAIGEEPSNYGYTST